MRLTVQYKLLRKAKEVTQIANIMMNKHPAVLKDYKIIRTFNVMVTRER